MNWSPDEDEKDGEMLVPWKGRERTPSASSPDPKPRKGFAAFIRSIMAGIRGYTLEDINRLKEAGVSLVEGKSKILHADAEAKIAEAAKAHADADLKRAQARQIDAETYLMMNSTAEVNAARQRFEAAISRIQQQGGQVAFDGEELQQLIAETKSDPLLLQTANDDSPE